MPNRPLGSIILLGVAALLGLASSGCAARQASGPAPASAGEVLAPHEPSGGRCPACPACPVLDTKMIAEAQRIDAENVENAGRVVRLEETVDDLRQALARAEEKTLRAQATAAAALDEAKTMRDAKGKPARGGRTAKASAPPPDDLGEDGEDEAEAPPPPRAGKKGSKERRQAAAARPAPVEQSAEQTRPAFEASNVATAGHKVRVRLSTELLFKLGGVRVSRAGRRALAEIAEVLKRTPSKRIEVRGHADNTGITQAWEDNWQISLERAHKVVAYLVARGVEPQRLVAMGFADTDPVADNDTREGREKNRRVEIFIEPTGGGPAARSE